MTQMNIPVFQFSSGCGFNSSSIAGEYDYLISEVNIRIVWYKKTVVVFVQWLQHLLQQ